MSDNPLKVDVTDTVLRDIAEARDEITDLKESLHKLREAMCVFVGLPKFRIDDRVELVDGIGGSRTVEEIHWLDRERVEYKLSGFKDPVPQHDLQYYYGRRYG